MNTFENDEIQENEKMSDQKENMSDSEIKTKFNEQSQKKRGRPKKTIVPKQIQKIELPIKEKEPEEEVLILRIPVFNESKDKGDDNSSEKNLFTMKDDSDVEDLKKESVKLIDSLTESEANSENSNEYDIKTLLLELKKKDQLIKKLKNQTPIQKPIQNIESGCIFNKEANKKIINLKLFDINNDGKPIIVDKTNIACWWCSYNFDTLPCFLADRYVNEKYYVFGCFCSYSCAMKYNSNLGDYRVATRQAIMKDLCNTIFGSTEMIIEAPEKELLEKFGGPMTIEEFRNHSLLCKKEFKIKIPPLMPLVSTVEEKFRDSSMNQKYYK